MTLAGMKKDMTGAAAQPAVVAQAQHVSAQLSHDSASSSASHARSNMAVDVLHSGKG